MKINIRALIAKMASAFARDLKLDAVYEKATLLTIMIAGISAVSAETWPIPSVIVGILAGMFGMTCYFVRHWKSPNE